VVRPPQTGQTGQGGGSATPLLFSFFKFFLKKIIVFNHFFKILIFNFNFFYVVPRVHHSG
jgi:hypothetical protein